MKFVIGFLFFLSVGKCWLCIFCIYERKMFNNILRMLYGRKENIKFSLFLFNMINMLFLFICLGIFINLK